MLLKAFLKNASFSLGSKYRVSPNFRDISEFIAAGRPSTTAIQHTGKRTGDSKKHELKKCPLYLSILIEEPTFSLVLTLVI